MEFAQKVGKKPGILTQSLEKLEFVKLSVSRFTFQNVIYKKSLIYIYRYVIFTLSTQTLIQSQIKLEFYKTNYKK